jgi:hypothetical protein
MTEAMAALCDRFRVSFWDTEYIPRDGEHVSGVCACALTYPDNKAIALTVGTEGQRPPNPLPFGSDDLVVCYSATAELGFFAAMGWPLPHNVLDLWTEYRNLTNGKMDNQGYDLETSLIAACHAYGVLDTTSVDEKDAMRDRILKGFPYTSEEMSQIVNYCHADVRMLRDLAEQMLPDIWNLDQALHRGRTMKAVACIEHNGVPVDTDTLGLLTANSMSIRRMVVSDFEDEYHTGIHVFDKNGNPHFSNKGFTEFVRTLGFTEKTWPHNERGFASADDKLGRVHTNRRASTINAK